MPPFLLLLFLFLPFFFLCWSQCDSLMICSLTTHIVFPALTVVAFSFLSFPFLFRFFLCPLTLRHKGGRFSHTVGVCNPPVVVIVRSLSPTPKQYLRFLPVFFFLTLSYLHHQPSCLCFFFSLSLFLHRPHKLLWSGEQRTAHLRGSIVCSALLTSIALWHFLWLSFVFAVVTAACAVARAAFIWLPQHTVGATQRLSFPECPLPLMPGACVSHSCACVRVRTQWYAGRLGSFPLKITSSSVLSFLPSFLSFFLHLLPRGSRSLQSLAFVVLCCVVLCCRTSYYDKDSFSPTSPFAFSASRHGDLSVYLFFENKEKKQPKNKRPFAIAFIVVHVLLLCLGANFIRHCLE